MAKRTVSNGQRTICTKKTDDRAVAMVPDVCQAPKPPPMPFANVGHTSSLTGGSSRSTTIDGGPIWIRPGTLHESTGGAPPYVGVKSGRRNAEVEPTDWSGDVYVEGEPVVRVLDTTFHNHRNTTGIVLPAELASSLAEDGDAALWSSLASMRPCNPCHVRGGP